MDIKLKKANIFWLKAYCITMEVAIAEYPDFDMPMHDNEFLFELFNEGSYVPTKEEILNAVKEYCEKA